MPVELSLCLESFIAKTYVSKFPYTFSDKVDQPQKIPNDFVSRGIIGGNEHKHLSL